MKRIVIIAGTRPEIIKIAPIMRRLQEGKSEYTFLFIQDSIMITNYPVKL